MEATADVFMALDEMPFLDQMELCQDLEDLEHSHAWENFSYSPLPTVPSLAHADLPPPALSNMAVTLPDGSQMYQAAVSKHMPPQVELPACHQGVTVSEDTHITDHQLTTAQLNSQGSGDELDMPLATRPRRTARATTSLNSLALQEHPIDIDMLSKLPPCPSTAIQSTGASPTQLDPTQQPSAQARPRTYGRPPRRKRPSQAAAQMLQLSAGQPLTCNAALDGPIGSTASQVAAHDAANSTQHIGTADAARLARGIKPKLPKPMTGAIANSAGLLPSAPGMNAPTLASHLQHDSLASLLPCPPSQGTAVARSLPNLVLEGPAMGRGDDAYPPDDLLLSPCTLGLEGFLDGGFSPSSQEMMAQLLANWEQDRERQQVAASGTNQPLEAVGAVGEASSAAARDLAAAAAEALSAAAAAAGESQSAPVPQEPVVIDAANMTAAEAARLAVKLSGELQRNTNERLQSLKLKTALQLFRSSGSHFSTPQKRSESELKYLAALVQRACKILHENGMELPPLPGYQPLAAPLPLQPAAPSTSTSTPANSMRSAVAIHGHSASKLPDTLATGIGMVHPGATLPDQGQQVASSDLYNDSATNVDAALPPTALASVSQPAEMLHCGPAHQLAAVACGQLLPVHFSSLSEGSNAGNDSAGALSACQTSRRTSLTADTLHLPEQILDAQAAVPTDCWGANFDAMACIKLVHRDSPLSVAVVSKKQEEGPAASLPPCHYLHDMSTNLSLQQWVAGAAGEGLLPWGAGETPSGVSGVQCSPIPTNATSQHEPFAAVASGPHIPSSQHSHGQQNPKALAQTGVQRVQQLTGRSMSSRRLLIAATEDDTRTNSGGQASNPRGHRWSACSAEEGGAGVEDRPAAAAAAASSAGASRGGRRCMMEGASWAASDAEDGLDEEDMETGSQDDGDDSGDDDDAGLGRHTLRPATLGASRREITLSALQKVFHMPINEAAKHLGVGVTVMKKYCRKFEISRWPYRKLQSMDHLITSVAECMKEDPAEFAGVLSELQQFRQTIMDNPSINFEERVKKLRQANFKLEYKQRQPTKRSFKSKASSNGSGPS